MGLYSSWVYIHVLNAYWFVWSVVIFVFVANAVAPLVLWFILRDKPIFGQGGLIKKWPWQAKVQNKKEPVI